MVYHLGIHTCPPKTEHKEILDWSERLLVIVMWVHVPFNRLRWMRQLKQVT